MSSAGKRLLSIVVCGLGNIGSHLVPLLARCPFVHALRLFDRDTYSADNLLGQDMLPTDAGRPKSRVAERQVHRISGSRINVQAIHADLNDVPLGVYHDSDVIIGGLDSRQSRIALAKKAWRAGRWYIDAGVNADEQLVRVTIYAPTTDGPCFLCGIDDDDWENIEATYACHAGQAESPPTHAPAYLGAAAAALAVNELCRLIANGFDPTSAGREVVLDMRGDHLVVSRHVRHSACRFDHAVWPIDAHVSASSTVIEALRLGPQGDNGSAVLRHESQPFVTRLTCINPLCGGGRKGGRFIFPESAYGGAGCFAENEPDTFSSPVPSGSFLRLANRLRPRDTRCPECGQSMVAGGFDRAEAISAAMLPRGASQWPLHRLGLRAGDVLAVGGSAAADEHYVLIGE